MTSQATSLNGNTSSYAEATLLLKTLMEGVPDTQFLEIRTIKKGGGATKDFHQLGKLRKQGFETALPVHLDGKENVYYGVCPRYGPRQAKSDADRGDAVDLATCIWLDEITRPPPDLLKFSGMVETSDAKVQAVCLLKEPTADLDRVEHLNQRLAAAVGGDKVWNRGRILRLPVFINLNHPGEQRAHLLEFHPERRYTLDELDRLLPPLPVDEIQGEGNRQRREYSGAFEPHWGTPLNEEDQAGLAQFLHAHGLRRQHDGRYSGSCILDHGGVPCASPDSLHVSPITGNWNCFGSAHVGKTSGSIRAFAPLGLISEFTLSEIRSRLGKNHLGAGEAPVETGPQKGFVANKVKTKNHLYPISDKRRRHRGKRPSLWDRAKDCLFPIPSHVRPRMKGCLLWSEWDHKGIAVDLFSNTWRNPANAQYKRQKLYFNMLPRINGLQVYQRQVPVDDWGINRHKSITRSIQRATTENQGWACFDNALDRGHFLYLTDVPGQKGFEPVADVQPVLVSALKSIHPPEQGEGEGRFCPVLGSDNWIGKTDDTGEDDAGRWEIIAVAHGPTDFVGIEAECVVAGVKTEYERSYWRSQPYQGLAMHHSSRAAFVAFAQGFPEQYALTKAVLAVAVGVRQMLATEPPLPTIELKGYQ